MSDSENEDDGPVVELGDGPVVEGAPLARVASRLTWPIERERLVEREGDAEIRTPDGPRVLASVLEGVETTYFDTRQGFVEAVRDEIGRGPVQPDADVTEDAATTDDDTTTGDGVESGNGTDAVADGVATENSADTAGSNDESGGA